MQKSKYEEQSGILDGFNDLMATLAPKIDPAEFIALQEKLLEQVSDKSSYEAEKILKRMIQFYHSAEQPEKADKIVENNLQIENFCRQAVEKRIAKQQYEDAKRLIFNYLKKNPSNYHRYWNEYILDIAQKEKDVHTVWKTAFGFISSHFDKKYYTIYRATFSAEEWANELENLILHYEQKKETTYWGNFNNRLDFNTSIADVLVAEKASNRLLTYLEKYSDVELVEKYYTATAGEFPERTLSLLQKMLDEFAEKNLGRDKYEYIKGLLKKMEKIKGGKEIVNKMVVRYRTVYKNRRAMLEVLGGF